MTPAVEIASLCEAALMQQRLYSSLDCWHFANVTGSNDESISFGQT
jgi:hypothetical protein